MLSTPPNSAIPTEAIAKTVKAIHANRPARVLDLNDLPLLQNELNGLKERVQDNQRLAERLKSDRLFYQQKLDACETSLAALANVGESASKRDLTMRAENARAGFEYQIAELDRRIKMADDIAKSTQKLVAAFSVDHPGYDDLLEEARNTDFAARAAQFPLR